MTPFIDQSDIPMPPAASPKPEHPHTRGLLIDLRSAWEPYSCTNTTFRLLNVADSLP